MNYRLHIAALAGQLLLIAPVFIAGAQTRSDSLVWPSPPERTRIRFMSSLSSLDSFEKKKGFFEKIFSFIGGSEDKRSWFVQPVGVAVSPSNLIVVTDPGAKGIHVLDLKEKEYNFIGSTKFGNFVSPVGCAFDEDGNLYVSDSDLGMIVVFDKDLDPIRSIKGELRRPTGIQASGGRVYITDTGLHKIFIFSKEGKLITSFGQRGAGAGEFNYPTFLSVRDSISVVDALNYRIQTFTVNGVFSSTFGEMGDVAGRFVSPKAICLDADGNRYVTDALMDNIQIFNPAGQLLLIVGRKGQRNGEFMTPEGIAFDRNNRMYVVDALNRRLQIFEYLR